MMQRKPSLTYFPRGMYSSNTVVNKVELMQGHQVNGKEDSH